jgi:hypothetical protein
MPLLVGVLTQLIHVQLGPLLLVLLFLAILRRIALQQPAPAAA